eukprot:GDKJ01060035.1.p2 GENE.GDKJ01060035.1~~GDKJ01060035.1.p2  ORF type:complete len:100 (+),score=8.42 GDKJ01060035.1:582-881(+)
MGDQLVRGTSFGKLYIHAKQDAADEVGHHLYHSQSTLLLEVRQTLVALGDHTHLVYPDNDLVSHPVYRIQGASRSWGIRPYDIVGYVASVCNNVIYGRL